MDDIHRARCMVLKAISDDTRLSIIELLSQKGELCITDIYRNLNQKQYHISHHMVCLRNCGLVKKRKEGRYVYYSLNKKERISRMLALIESHAKEHLEHILKCRVVK